MPEVVVLGVAQDGGVPHAGCLCPNCRAARSDPGRRHLPVSLGLVSGDRFAMVDATSGFEAQHAMLWNHSSAAGASAINEANTASGTLRPIRSDSRATTMAPTAGQMPTTAMILLQVRSS